MNWIHRLLNPHCTDCERELSCNSCETLRIQLDQANLQNQKLLQTIIDLTKPVVPQVQIAQETESTAPIKPFVSWRTKQRILEAEDRANAKLIADKKREMDSLNADPGLAKLEEVVLEGVNNAS